jgi:hypothetical protein
MDFDVARVVESSLYLAVSEMKTAQNIKELKEAYDNAEAALESYYDVVESILKEEGNL